ncbi:DNA-binding transcriptional regulator, AcrR family [Rhodococcoides kyotonense]|uniref:DNA-binding transcriptional regulator, AcrR family n=1 Tax=Rhodococcoides kyotonense TaxID=398843 RepID=A0A239JJM5_9NOCA|nr:TetR/AcrR family transcriptional regulator [Rhodococcus kyotonensis]SNT05523.1 DNA-binding transcriptional regulator, AcrR family [Rhodococcus kyotonensis]
MPEQPYHHGNLRSTLLEQAEATLTRVGVEGLSLRQLARDVGVSHAAPSKHFRDKQTLLDALAESGFHRMTAAMTNAVDGPADARSRMFALAHTYVHFALDNAALLALMYSTKHTPGATAQLIAAGQSSMDLTVSVVEDAQASGDIRSGDAKTIALVTFSTFHGIATLAAGQMLDGADVDVVVEAAASLLWAGLTA